MVFKEVAKWLRTKWSLWKHGVPVALNGLISIVCYVVGWRLSTVSDTGPLVHAGALATVSSIAFTLYDYRSALKDGEKSVTRLFERITAQFPLTGVQSLDGIKAKAERNTKNADRTITLLQGGLLITATLVWGFGDIAPKWAPWAFR